MEMITPNQIKAIHALLKKNTLQQNKEAIIRSFTERRTGSVKGMYKYEAGLLISRLISLLINGEAKDKNRSSPMMAKLFAMAHEIGWITKKTVVKDGKLMQVNDYSRVYSWVEKYSYLRKPLREFTFNELPKLVSQFETKIYNDYITNLNKANNG